MELQEYYFLSVDYDGEEVFLREEGELIVPRAFEENDDSYKWYVGNHSSGLGSGINSGSINKYLIAQGGGEVSFGEPRTVFVLGEEDGEGNRTISIDGLYLTLPTQYDSSVAVSAEAEDEGKKQKWKFALADPVKGL